MVIQKVCSLHKASTFLLIEDPFDKALRPVFKDGKEKRLYEAYLDMNEMIIKKRFEFEKTKKENKTMNPKWERNALHFFRYSYFLMLLVSLLIRRVLQI